MPRISGSSELTIKDGHALGGQLVDELVDLDLGAHVDAARRLVEDEHLGLGGQPLGEHHLLLGAAGEVERQLLLAGAS